MIKKYNITCICGECKTEFTEVVNKDLYDKYKDRQPFTSICDDCIDKKKRK